MVTSKIMGPRKQLLAPCMQIAGHGNFGSLDDDPPAAMRYTECRLQVCYRRPHMRAQACAQTCGQMHSHAPTRARIHTHTQTRARMGA
eukprot:1160786-Pelagomonas_calceolata.AAC.10